MVLCTGSLSTAPQTMFSLSNKKWTCWILWYSYMGRFSLWEQKWLQTVTNDNILARLVLDDEGILLHS